MIQSTPVAQDGGSDWVPLIMGGVVRKNPLTEPLPFAALVLCVIAGFLALDHFANADEQLLLGAATWAILIAACAPFDREDRARAMLVVAVASCAEVIGSILLGAYTYRLDNLPAFVPPGHGLVYLAALRISQSPLVRRHPRVFIRIVVLIVAAWGLSGLFLLGRTDVVGAITGAALIYVLLRGRSSTLYAGVFLVVAFLEVYGTSIGAWHWAATTPDADLPTGNPPSGIAGVYVLFDIAAIALAPRLLAALETGRSACRQLGSQTGDGGERSGVGDLFTGVRQEVTKSDRDELMEVRRARS